MRVPGLPFPFPFPFPFLLLLLILLIRIRVLAVGLQPPDGLVLGSTGYFHFW